MKFIKLIFLTLAITLSGTSALKAQNAEKILKKHIAAMGGNKWNDIKTITIASHTKALSIEVDGNETMDVTKEKMRIDMSVMGTDCYIIVTPEGGWGYMPARGVTPLPADDAKEQLKKMNFRDEYLIDKSNIKSIEYAGNETIDNVPCYKLNITGKDDNTQTAFFDIATYYLVCSVKHVKTAEHNFDMTFNYSNFQEVPGSSIIMPMTTTSEHGTVTYKTIEINKPIDEKIFTPDAPAAAADGETEPPKKEISK